MQNPLFSLKVVDLEASDREVFEHVLGLPLGSNQQLIVQVVEPPNGEREAPPSAKVAELPEWCRLYEGMSDEEIESFERTLLTRADMTREFD